MSRIIAMASGKGGVGKTTLCASIAAALAQFGKSVIVIDTNLTTANLGLHLGMPFYPVTLQDVLKKRARLKDAIYYHNAGFGIIPASISVEHVMVPKQNDIIDAAYKAASLADIVLLDSAAGLGREASAALQAADEVLIVTNPEMPAITDALKLSKIAQQYEVRRLGYILNRVRMEKHEISRREIQELLELPFFGIVQEDRRVKEAIAARMPVVLHRPRAKVSRQIKAVAARLANMQYKETLSDMFFGWFR
ncbi:MAG: AAA family ATPase [Candidatus Aenigmarchaeota archaeon]|nr:AAA family ATPase [Candidatus Aenigmarchaeota archaeon]